MEAARLTAVERMPAVSQVSTGPVGGSGEDAGEAGGGWRRRHGGGGKGQGSGKEGWRG